MPVVPAAMQSAQVMHFHSSLADADNVEVTSLEGEEAISKPFHFSVEIASRDRGLDVESLINEKVHVAIKKGVDAGGGTRNATTLKIHGVLSNVEQIGRQLEWVKFRVDLVPRLWRLSLSHNSRIFQNKKIPDLVKEICESCDVKIDISKLNVGDYKEREYIVQYEESDLDFIHRWMEHEGIFYYFTHDESEETMVLGDAPEAYGALPVESEFQYKPNPQEEPEPAKAAAWLDEETISAISCIKKQLPKEVVLNDYNWRTPADKLECKATVSDDGIGTVYEYNNHFSDTDEGKVLAEVRAEEINCREFEFRGRSDARNFRAGAVFTLRTPQNPREREQNGVPDGFYQEYLIVEVRHRARLSVALDGGPGAGASYVNRFLAIPKSKSFRPPCIAPWPCIKGVMHAIVDGGDDSTPYAQIDDLGRYKVKMPLDRGDATPGNASRAVRKAESYAGPNQGMHFPLLKGAEVLISHIDGDPDRPIIVGSMYNEQNTSVVNQNNHTLNVLITPIGNTFSLDDTQGAPQIILYTQDEKNKFLMDGTDGSEKITLKSTVSNAYLRLGTADGESGGEHISGANGIFISADDHVNIKAGANLNLHSGAHFNHAVLGNSTVHIHGSREEKIDGNKTAKTISWTKDLMIGDYNVVNLAAKVALSAGATATAQIGAELKVAYALSASITRGDGFSTTFGKMFKIDKSSTTELTLEGRKFVTVLDKKVTSKAGNVEIEATAGQVKIKAATKISLECGGSKIELTPNGIKFQKGGSRQTMNDSLARLKATTIEMKASSAFTAKGSTAKVN